MKNKKITCSRGHTFKRENGITTCPKCWPGKYKDFIFHKDGTVWAREKISDKKAAGWKSWEWYRKDGVIMRSGYLKANKQVGKWMTYDKKGKVFKVTEM